MGRKKIVQGGGGGGRGRRGGETCPGMEEVEEGSLRSYKDKKTFGRVSGEALIVPLPPSTTKTPNRIEVVREPKVLRPQPPSQLPKSSNQPHLEVWTGCATSLRSPCQLRKGGREGGRDHSSERAYSKRAILTREVWKQKYGRLLWH